MEIIEKRYKTLLDSLQTLKQALDLLNNPEYKIIIKTLEDSVIQRFEYTIDTFWKFLKIYLQIKQNIDIFAASPRAILRETAIAGMINETELRLLEKSISDRNLTSHTYNEELAEVIVSHIPEHYDVMKKVVMRMQL